MDEPYSEYYEIRKRDFLFLLITIDQTKKILDDNERYKTHSWWKYVQEGLRRMENDKARILRSSDLLDRFLHELTTNANYRNKYLNMYRNEIQIGKNELLNEARSSFENRPPNQRFQQKQKSPQKSYFERPSAPYAFEARQKQKRKNPQKSKGKQKQQSPKKSYFERTRVPYAFEAQQKQKRKNPQKSKGKQKQQSPKKSYFERTRVPYGAQQKQSPKNPKQQTQKQKQQTASRRQAAEKAGRQRKQRYAQSLRQRQRNIRQEQKRKEKLRQNVARQEGDQQRQQAEKERRQHLQMMRQRERNIEEQKRRLRAEQQSTKLQKQQMKESERDLSRRECHNIFCKLHIRKSEDFKALLKKYHSDKNVNQANKKERDEFYKLLSNCRTLGYKDYC